MRKGEFLLLAAAACFLLSSCTGSGRTPVAGLVGSWERIRVSVDGYAVAGMDQATLQFSDTDFVMIYYPVDLSAIHLRGVWTLEDDTLLRLEADSVGTLETVMCNLTDSTLDLKIDPYTIERYQRIRTD